MSQRFKLSLKSVGLGTQKTRYAGLSIARNDLQSNLHITFCSPENEGINFPGRVLWKSYLHEHLKAFLWRLVHNGLPVKLKLAAHNPARDPRCPLCNDAEEVALHLFFMCPFALAIWFCLPWTLWWKQFVHLQTIPGLLAAILRPEQSMQIPHEQADDSTSSCVIVLHEIRSIHNRYPFYGCSVDIYATIQRISHRCQEAQVWSLSSISHRRPPLFLLSQHKTLHGYHLRQTFIKPT